MVNYNTSNFRSQPDHGNTIQNVSETETFNKQMITHDRVINGL